MFKFEQSSLSVALVKQHNANLHRPSRLLKAFPFTRDYSAQFPLCCCFYPFFHLLRNTVGHNELITRPAWLWMVAASPRIKAANPQMQAQSNVTEHSFWHIRAKLILVWTYFGCFEALRQQSRLGCSANLCCVRSKSKWGKRENRQPMRPGLAGNVIRSSLSSSFTVLFFFLVVVYFGHKSRDHKELAVHL